MDVVLSILPRSTVTVKRAMRDAWLLSSRLALLTLFASNKDSDSILLNKIVLASTIGTGGASGAGACNVLV